MLDSSTHFTPRAAVLMEAIGKSLPGILRGYLRRESPPLIEILAPLWPRVAGAAIARHSRPASFTFGMLTVETASDIWARQLRLMAEEIRAGINAYLGVRLVKQLQVRQSPRVGPTRADAVQPETPSRGVDPSLGSISSWP